MRESTMSSAQWRSAAKTLVTYIDCTDTTYLVKFGIGAVGADVTRLHELIDLYKELSAEELLIAIELREGRSQVWTAIDGALATPRRKGKAKSVTWPPLSGEQAHKFLASQGEWVNSVDFLQSSHWARVRMLVLERDGAKCACCGKTRKDGVVLNVDHIKSRREHPSLALDPDNLQVLCADCNNGKGNRFATDWR